METDETLQVCNRAGHKELMTTEPGFLNFVLTEKEKARLRTFKILGYRIKTGRATVDVLLYETQQKAFHKTVSLLEARAQSMAALD